MTLRDLIAQCAALRNSFYKGLKAIKNRDKRLIYASRPRAIIGSIDIDATMQASQRHDHLWDYLIGVKEEKQCAYFVEVHSAETSQVNVVLQKLTWLHGFVSRELPDLNRKEFDSMYYWVGTNGVHIPRTTPQYRLLAENDLKVISHLVL
jgi:hypothetical protein